jgi:hypothetical protein
MEIGRGAAAVASLALFHLANHVVRWIEARWFGVSHDWSILLDLAGGVTALLVLTDRLGWLESPFGGPPLVIERATGPGDGEAGRNLDGAPERPGVSASGAAGRRGRDCGRGARCGRTCRS